LRLKRFLKDAKPLMSDAEREELIIFLGENPEAGKVMPVHTHKPSISRS
jgi:dsDNA-binding SOS-regulon protein